MATTVVDFDGWQLIGVSPLGGKFWTLNVEGWLSKNTRRSRETKAAQSGDWPSTGVTAGRPITITGRADYANATSAAMERRALLALGGIGARRLTIEDAGGALTCLVEVDSVVVSPRVDDELTFDFVFSVYATDPILYGELRFGSTGIDQAAVGSGRVWSRVWARDWGVPDGFTAGSLQLPNEGTAAYRPRLRIDGPVTNPTVTLNETGDTLRYNGSLAAGQWLDIDLDQRRAMLAGRASVANRIQWSGNWLAVPPGGASVSWTAEASSSTATLSAWFYESAWE